MIDFRFIVSFLFIFIVTINSVFADINAFVYHRFGDQRYPSTNISLERFEEHLTEIETKGYRVVTLSDALALMNSTEPDVVASKLAVITVDDGYRTFLTGAMPILRRHGMVATVFVNTESVGLSDEFLSWPELLQLQEEGIEIGNHSHAHMHMAQPRDGETVAEWNERVVADLKRSKSIFKSKFISVPRVIAYPYGEYSLALQQLIRDEGFTVAVAQQSGVISKYSDKYAIPRFPMGGPYTSLASFSSKLKMKALPVIQINVDPVLSENPPSLVVKIDAISGNRVDMGRATCFVNGRADCTIQKLDDSYLIKSVHELKQKRNKYTLTAPGVKGGWYWYSQLFIHEPMN